MDLVIETFHLWQGSQCSFFGRNAEFVGVIFFAVGFLYVHPWTNVVDFHFASFVLNRLIHSEEEGALRRR